MTEPDTYRVPSDEELLAIYGKGTGALGDGSSYDGWLALWMAGYRDGALVRPNVESKASTVGEAWTEYYRPGMSSEEAQAFKAGFAYGKRAGTSPGVRHPRWFGFAYGVFVGGIAVCAYLLLDWLIR